MLPTETALEAAVVSEIEPSLHDRQRECLRRTIDRASAIESMLHTHRQAHLGEVHFRPSSKAIAMVGLHPHRPQRGLSKITNVARLAADFDTLFRQHCVDCDHKRVTPEKRLQSYLVAEAYRHDRRLPLPFSESATARPRFVTDELALPIEGGRIVCDLIAFADDRLIVIELKSSREMKRLIAQVTEYAQLVDRHTVLFAELSAVILGLPVTVAQRCERWIVWPGAPGHDRDPRADALAQHGIRVITYVETPDGFAFESPLL